MLIFIRFCKYFTEDFSLYYVRTHYISFIKLYNKKLRTVNAFTHPEDISSSSIHQGRGQTQGVHTGKPIPGENAVNKSALILCNLHLKCLLSIAINRNNETTRNFLKNRIVDFLTTEIELEYDVKFSFLSF